MSEKINPKLDGTGLSQVWTMIVSNFVTQMEGKGLSANDFTNALKDKLNNIPENIYSQNEVYNKNETDTAITNAVKEAVAGIYKIKGSISFANLPSTDLKEGYVYNITDKFITTDLFVEGAGKSYPAGTNIVYTQNGWDCMAGIFDFSDFVMKDEIRSLTSEEIAAICVI